jgi:hypothetical protein
MRALQGCAKEDEQEKERLPLHHLLSEPETQAETRLINRKTGGKTTRTRHEGRNARVQYGSDIEKRRSSGEAEGMARAASGADHLYELWQTAAYSQLS